MTPETPVAAIDERDQLGLLRWQWSLYPRGHQDRRNLLMHILTWPIFLASTVTIVASLLTLHWMVLAFGFAGLIFAIVAQGRGHKLEKSAPVPFRGPGDVMKRLFVEQWVTFPRYLLSGEFAKAWSRAK
jgi:hypothetical protein